MSLMPARKSLLAVHEVTCRYTILYTVRFAKYIYIYNLFTSLVLLNVFNSCSSIRLRRFRM